MTPIPDAWPPIECLVHFTARTATLEPAGEASRLLRQLAVQVPLGNGTVTFEVEPGARHGINDLFNDHAALRADWNAPPFSYLSSGLECDRTGVLTLRLTLELYQPDGRYPVYIPRLNGPQQRSVARLWPVPFACKYFAATHRFEIRGPLATTTPPDWLERLKAFRDDLAALATTTRPTASANPADSR